MMRTIVTIANGNRHVQDHERAHGRDHGHDHERYRG
jgi:hypothetical protein